ncbi:hypothetical protein DFP94_11495 [Fontibacillus phaseoli]|uniref:Uncharacterized protein n=1 Tax=Fontibacillus phaseoli TaxID=1416533 RepID=A0A369B517_9BACL|nr:hypothetical protein DFP94_11495 [Fontibacillus phaseoli]
MNTALKPGRNSSRLSILIILNQGVESFSIIRINIELKVYLSFLKIHLKLKTLFFVLIRGSILIYLYEVILSKGKGREGSPSINLDDLRDTLPCLGYFKV